MERDKLQMVRVLAIETSGSVGSVALVEDEHVLAERIFEKGMVHGRELAPSISQILGEAAVSLSDVNLIAVDIGPGSYTGLRVGMATAKGMCLALHKPIRGIVSLDAMAERAKRSEDFESRILCPAIDAKWNLLYGALYAPDRTGKILAEKPEEFARRVPEDAVVFGSALDRYGGLFGNRLRLGSDHAYPLASVVGLLAAREFTEGKQDDMMSLVPLYLKQTEAEINAKKK